MKVLVAEDDLASGKFMQKLLSKYNRAGVYGCARLTN